MKRHLSTILAMAVAAVLSTSALTACDGTDETGGFTTDLAVNSNAITLPATGGETNIAIYADGSWTAAMPDSISWATLSTMNGKGNGYAYLKYNANFDEDPRQTVITVTAGGHKAEIVVTQQGQNNN